MAKTARYRGEKLQLFADTKTVVESKYKLKNSDETQLAMTTESKWFSPEGLSQNPRGEGAEAHDLVDKSINIALVVTLLPDGDDWVVKVTPVLARFNRGNPLPEQLKEGDPSLPGWVQSKVDSLALDIHNGLAKYQVQSVPGQVPASASPPASAPPAAGSDAGSAAPATP